MAEYLDAALTNINMMRYLENLQEYNSDSEAEEQKQNEVQEDDITIINPT